MNKKISPSIMCADFFELERHICDFENNDIDLIHVDIMDGSFVPNYTLGTDFVRQLKRKTDIPLDIHLMIEDPEKKIDWFEFGENDYVSVHCESTRHLDKAICAIKERKAKAMVAINPGTSINTLDAVLDDIDAVLVMTVNPGFAGQKLIPSTLGKIRLLRERLDLFGREHIEIEVDGNVSFENAALMNSAGANIFVAGTSAVFRKDISFRDAISKFRNVISAER